MNEREFDLTVAVLEVLKAMGDTPLGQAHLEKYAARKTTPPGTPSEIRERVKWLESRQLVLSTRDDVGLHYSITLSGKVWLQQNG